MALLPVSWLELFCFVCVEVTHRQSVVSSVFPTPVFRPCGPTAPTMAPSFTWQRLIALGACATLGHDWQWSYAH